MNARHLKGFTGNLANAALVAGTTSTYTTTVVTNCVIGGKFCTQLSAQTNTASPTTDINTGAAFVAVQPEQGCVFVWGLNAAGAVKVAQGTRVPLINGVTTTPGSFVAPPQFPALPDDFAPFGYTVIKTGPSAAAWTFGSGAWAASGVSATFVNVCELPDRPQVS